MENMESNQQQTARLAGLLYLLLAITGGYGMMYVGSQLYVRGDAQATAANILANEGLFRSGIVSTTVSGILFLFMALVLYRLFKPVNEFLALTMLVLVVLQAPVGLVIETSKITALYILKGEVLKAHDAQQLNDHAFMFLKVSGYATNALEMYWGLWLFPLAQLILRSGFMPRIIALLVYFAAAGYTIDSFTFVIAPDFRAYTNMPALIFSALGELSVAFWLLIKGVRIARDPVPTTA